MPPAERKAILLKLADLIRENLEEFALLDSLDMGKLVQDAVTIDAPGSAMFFQWHAEAIDKMYDEIAPMGDNFSLIMIFIIFIGYFYSLFQLFRFKKIGRQIYIIVMALAILSVFSIGYTVYDPLEYLSDCLGSIITGFIIASSYFSKIAKEFK